MKCECGPIHLRTGRWLSETSLSRLSDKNVAQPNEREFCGGIWRDSPSEVICRLDIAALVLRKFPSMGRSWGEEYEPCKI